LDKKQSGHSIIPITRCTEKEAIFVGKTPHFLKNEFFVHGIPRFCLGLVIKTTVSLFLVCFLYSMKEIKSLNLKPQLGKDISVLVFCSVSWGFLHLNSD
jgi:hypothetical protein